MKLVLVAAQMNGTLNCKIKDVTPAERQALTNLEGLEIEIPKQKGAAQTPDEELIGDIQEMLLKMVAIMESKRKKTMTAELEVSNSL